jgi:hypothetical protein
MTCLACRARRHGAECEGCDCRCRAMLALDLFPFGNDPTSPGVIDQMEAAG